MATLFSSGILASFSGVFTFLFVYVLVFGMLMKTKVFGENSDGLNAILALCASIFALFSPLVVQLVAYMIPWLVLLLVVSLMILIFMNYLDIELNPAKDGGAQPVAWVFFIIILIIFLMGLAKYTGNDYNVNSDKVMYVSESVVVSENMNSTTQVKVVENEKPRWLKVLMSKQVMGFIVFMAIGGLTIMQMGNRKD